MPKPRAHVSLDILMGRQGGVSPKRVLSDRDMNFSGTMARRSVFSCSSSVVMTSGHVRGAKGAWSCVFRAQIDATNPSERGPALLAVQSRRGPTVTGLASGREANNGCMSSQRFLRVLLSGDGPCRGNFAVSLFISNILTVHCSDCGRHGWPGRPQHGQHRNLRAEARPRVPEHCGRTALVHALCRCLAHWTLSLVCWFQLSGTVCRRACRGAIRCLC